MDMTLVQKLQHLRSDQITTSARTRTPATVEVPQNVSTSPYVLQVGTYMYLLVQTEYIYVPSRIPPRTYMYPFVYDRVDICTQSYMTEYIYVPCRIRQSTYIYLFVYNCVHMCTLPCATMCVHFRKF